MTDAIRQSTIKSGDFSLRTYELDGVHFQRSGIEVYNRFEACPIIASISYEWQFTQLSSPFRPLTIWVYFSTIVTAGLITLTLRNVYNNQIVWQLVFDISKCSQDYGTVKVWDLPIVVLDRYYFAEIISDTNANLITIFTQDVHVEKVIKTNPSLPR